MITIDNVRSIPSLPIGNECTATKADTSRFDHLKGLPISSMNGSVCLLIGSDTPEAFYELDERRGKTTQPRAIKTTLGWTIQGPSSKKSTNSNVLINFVSSQELDAKATQTLKPKLSDSMEPHEEAYEKEHKEYDETILTDRCTTNCADHVFQILQPRTTDTKTGTFPRHRKEDYRRKKSKIRRYCQNTT